MTDPQTYRMTLSLNVLNHFGIGLYSNIPAVLSELVANAWDADARTVRVNLNAKEGFIEVIDDGHGMTVADINERFLKVGYQRRENGAMTALGRPVMGRKGIGKLATFSIAQLVEVHTIRDQASALRMDRREIESRINKDNASEYHPVSIRPELDGLSTGTRLVLRDLDKRTSWAAPHLRRRIARRFSVIGPSRDFSVVVNDEAITAKDRDFYDKLEFLWYFGDKSIADGKGSVERTTRLKPKIPVSGWIGTVDRPKTLDEVNNSIVLLSRGKLVHENILPDFREAGVYAQYVIGEVNADFLDRDDREDIVTTGRQSVKEHDPRYREVIDFVQCTLNTIKSQWTQLRIERGEKRALEYPTVKAWHDRLGHDQRKTAGRLFGKIESLALRDREAKKELYRATMLAFEKFALKDMLSLLEDVKSGRDFRALSRLVKGVDELEAAHYHEVVKGRLGVIDKLVDILPEAREKVLQEHVFDHLWLLHPSWERAATNPRIEETVRKEFGDVEAGLAPEERAGRIDIRYKTAAGKHIIVELKKYDRSVSVEDLLRQLRKYLDALDKCLHTKFPKVPRHIEAIAVLGEPPTPADKDERNRRLLRELGARYITYDRLVKEAQDTYQDYLERQKKVSELVGLLDGLDADFQ